MIRIFFLEFSNSDIINSNINVEVDFEKQESHLSLHFQLKGYVQTTCDRCLEALTIQIDYNPNLYVKFGEKTSDLTDIDDNMILARNEDKLELAKHFYDYVMINMPIQKVHSNKKGSNDKCNTKMLKHMEAYKAGTSILKEGDIDPRWEKLKYIYN